MPQSMYDLFPSLPDGDVVRAVVQVLSPGTLKLVCMYQSPADDDSGQTMQHEVDLLLTARKAAFKLGTVRSAKKGQMWVSK